MASKLIYIDAAAEMLGVPVLTLRTWIHHGYGPRSAKIGKRRMWRVSDIEDWIEAQFAADSSR